jgi:hypothetical protein
VNLAVVPARWWAWQCVKLSHDVTSTPKEYDGLWRDRLHARRGRFQRGSEAWWSVRDSASATVCADDVVGQLETVAVPLLRRLLIRENLAACAREGNLGHARGEQHRLFFDHALAALLVDQGPSEELARLIARIDENPDERLRAANEGYVRWLRDRISAST